jgi:hypothetical protein
MYNSPAGKGMKGRLAGGPRAEFGEYTWVERISKSLLGYAYQLLYQIPQGS